MQDRLAYADFYDLLESQWDLLQDELIFWAKALNRFIVSDQVAFAQDIRTLGLHPNFGSRVLPG